MKRTEGELVDFILENTRGGGVKDYKRKEIVEDSIMNVSEYTFDEINESWYIFVSELLKFLGYDRYFFDMWYQTQIKKSEIVPEIKVGLMEEMYSIVESIIEDYGILNPDSLLKGYAD